MSRRDLLIRKWFNLLFILISLYVFAYPVGRLSFWFTGSSLIGWVAGLAAWASTIAASRYVFSGPIMKPRYVVVHWMGTSFIIASVTLLVDLYSNFTDLDNLSLLQISLLLSIVTITIAILYSHYLSVKRLTIRSGKITKAIRIIQLSDVHIGSRQKGFMARIVNKLNKENPDFVVITGDLIDSSAVEIEALSAISSIKAPTLFSIGNHERYADLPKMMRMAEQLGMTTLRQQTYSSGELTFTGIDDADDPDQVGKQLAHIPQNEEHFNILLYHRPTGWESAIEHGIDLMLSGHTHKGQIFPFNWLVKQQFRRIAGLYENGQSKLYVSAGTGTWGPLMRLGSSNEITLFELEPEIQRT